MKVWIARDFDGGLYTFSNKPWLQTVDKIWLDYPTYIDWKDDNSYSEQLDCNLFPEITFENSPQEIEINSVSEIIGIIESPSKTFPRVNEFEVGASYRR